MQLNDNQEQTNRIQAWFDAHLEQDLTSIDSLDWTEEHKADYRRYLLAAIAKRDRKQRQNAATVAS